MRFDHITTGQMVAMGLMIAEGRPGDLKEVHALLRTVGLSDDVADRITDFLVVREEGQFVACAALEDYGTAGLLRSVAVAPCRRNQGLARYLVSALIARARDRRLGAVYLLTDTAAEYFARYGFRRISRAEVRPDVLASSQFRGEQCASATVMVLDLIESPAPKED